MATTSDVDEPDDLRHYQIPEELIRQLPSDLAHQFRAIPLRVAGDTLLMATDSPDDRLTLDDLEHILGHKIEFLGFESSEVDIALAKYYPPEPTE